MNKFEVKTKSKFIRDIGLISKKDTPIFQMIKSIYIYKLFLEKKNDKKYNLYIVPFCSTSYITPLFFSVFAVEYNLDLLHSKFLFRWNFNKSIEEQTELKSIFNAAKTLKEPIPLFNYEDLNKWDNSDYKTVFIKNILKIKNEDTPEVQFAKCVSGLKWFLESSSKEQTGIETYSTFDFDDLKPTFIVSFNKYGVFENTTYSFSWMLDKSLEYQNKQDIEYIFKFCENLQRTYDL